MRCDKKKQENLVEDTLDHRKVTNISNAETVKLAWLGSQAQTMAKERRCMKYWHIPYKDINKHAQK